MGSDLSCARIAGKPDSSFLQLPRRSVLELKKNRKFIKMQLAHPERNLASIDVLIACGTSFLAAGWHWYKKLLVVC
jgi:hypothetical protein